MSVKNLAFYILFFYVLGMCFFNSQRGLFFMLTRSPVVLYLNLVPNLKRELVNRVAIRPTLSSSGSFFQLQLAVAQVHTVLEP